ncbi:MAG: hypothetical protein Q9184_005890 [Pyrenodesmia sp. 2 TL-2023]
MENVRNVRNKITQHTMKLHFFALSHPNPLKPRAHQKPSPKLSSKATYNTKSFTIISSTPPHPNRQATRPTNIMSSTTTLSLSTTSTGSTTNSTPIRRLGHRIKDATLECLAGAILRIVDPTLKPSKSIPRNRLRKKSGRKQGQQPYCSRGFATGFVNSWEEVWN